LKSNVSRLAGALALSLFASLAAAAVDAPAGAQSARVIVKFKADSGLLRKQAASAGETPSSTPLRLAVLFQSAPLPLPVPSGVTRQMPACAGAVARTVSTLTSAVTWRSRREGCMGV
jgi:hypothetical protein